MEEQWALHKKVNAHHALQDITVLNQVARLQLESAMLASSVINHQ